MLSAAVLALAGGWIPLDLAAFDARGAYVSYLRAELFFVLFLWPLFVAHRPEPAPTLWSAAVLMLLSVPLSLITAGLSAMPTEGWLRGRALVAATTLLPAGVFCHRWSERYASSYFLAAFVVSIGTSYLAFLAPHARWLESCSVFAIAPRVVDAPAPADWACLSALATAGLALIGSALARARTPLAQPPQGL
jgi:hypothetical protein